MVVVRDMLRSGVTCLVLQCLMAGVTASREAGEALPGEPMPPDTALFSSVSAPLAHPLSGSCACLSTLSLSLQSAGWVMTGCPHDARGRTGALP